MLFCVVLVKMTKRKEQSSATKDDIAIMAKSGQSTEYHSGRGVEQLHCLQNYYKAL